MYSLRLIVLHVPRWADLPTDTFARFSFFLIDVPSVAYTMEISISKRKYHLIEIALGHAGPSRSFNFLVHASAAHGPQLRLL
jgi:hypothetical protein